MEEWCLELAIPEQGPCRLLPMRWYFAALDDHEAFVWANMVRVHQIEPLCASALQPFCPCIQVSFRDLIHFSVEGCAGHRGVDRKPLGVEEVHCLLAHRGWWRNHQPQHIHSPAPPHTPPHLWLQLLQLHAQLLQLQLQLLQLEFLE